MELLVKQHKRQARRGKRRQRDEDSDDLITLE
jgi:hypothetical protein